MAPNSIWIHLPCPAPECFPGNEHLEQMPSSLGYWRDAVSCDSSTRAGLLSCKQPGVSLPYTCKVSRWLREESSGQKHCLSCWNKAESLHVHSWIIPRAKEGISYCSLTPLAASQSNWSVCIWVLWKALWAFLWASVHHSHQSTLTETRLWKYVFFGSWIWLFGLFVKPL